MSAPNDAFARGLDAAGPELDVIVLPRRAAVDAVNASWDAGRAVCVLDISSPAAVIAATIDRLRPHALIDESGRTLCTDPTPNDRDLCAIIATSGTGGEPKLVELSATARDAAAIRVNDALGITSADRWLLTLPVGSVAALAILARARLSYTPVEVHDHFDPMATIASKASLVSLVPTQLQRCAALGAGCFRGVLLGGAAAPKNLAPGWPIHRTYGSTETWGGIVHDGVPFPDVALRIGEHREIGELGEPREIGEIELRTPSIFTRYRGDEPRTRAAFTNDGWYRTGDAGSIDASGRLTVLGRLDDMIISGGHNISPLEVENAIRAAFDVADVAVIGCDDPHWGQHVHAIVVEQDRGPELTLDALRSELVIDGHKRPRQLTIVRELPRTSNGKVQKLQLREQFGCGN
ncbi:MAG: fatty acid--CoA ligase family protein [Acidimicrobiia bacterium]